MLFFLKSSEITIFLPGVGVTPMFKSFVFMAAKRYTQILSVHLLSGVNIILTLGPFYILAVSDFIDSSLEEKIKAKELGAIDLIVSCGDLAPEYLSFLRDRLDRPLYYVKGNHDIRYSLTNPVGCDNLHARIKTLNGINFLGLEGSMWYNGGPNQYTDVQMKKIISRLWFSFWRKKGVHVVITHAPPFGIKDGTDLCHRGFDSFISLIRKRKPGYLIHGHIHKDFDQPGDRITRVNGTQVINACGYTIIEVVL